jgi:CD109 antigen
VDNYFLEAKAIDGEKFEKKVNLHLNLKKFSVFTQTDKSIYKPSENIQFRVLILCIDTKPYESSNVQIFITDGAQNRVKQFLNPKFKKGVFEGELQLSDSPVMGDWAIHVKVDESQEVLKDFEVAEYILPKFQVIVEANPHVTFSDEKIRATVSGKYTFGKLAKGKATVTAKVVQNRFGYGMPNQAQKVVKTVDVDGKKDVEFDIKQELKISDTDSEISVDIEATFMEELSGREHSGSTSVLIHKTPHKLDIVKSNEKIKPGLPYSITAFVKTHNGAPVLTDAENPVEFAITYYREVKNAQTNVDSIQFRGYGGGYQEESERKFERVFLANGSAELLMEVPKNVSRIEIDANYLKTHERTHRIEKLDSESGQFIQMKVLTKK